jgi:hypothetical protein
MCCFCAVCVFCVCVSAVLHIQIDNLHFSYVCALSTGSTRKISAAKKRKRNRRAAVVRLHERNSTGSKVPGGCDTSPFSNTLGSSDGGSSPTYGHYRSPEGETTPVYACPSSCDSKLAVIAASSTSEGTTPVYACPSSCDSKLAVIAASSTSEGTTPVYACPSSCDSELAVHAMARTMTTVHPWTPLATLTSSPSSPVTHPPRALRFPQSDSIESSEDDADKFGATGTDLRWLRRCRQLN